MSDGKDERHIHEHGGNYRHINMTPQNQVHKRIAALGAALEKIVAN
jgi:hypothetical protein